MPVHPFRGVRRLFSSAKSRVKLLLFVVIFGLVIRNWRALSTEDSLDGNGHGPPSTTPTPPNNVERVVKQTNKRPFELQIITIAVPPSKGNHSLPPWSLASLRNKRAYLESQHLNHNHSSSSSFEYKVRLRPITTNIAGNKWNPVWSKWVGLYRVLGELAVEREKEREEGIREEEGKEVWAWLLDLDTVITNLDTSIPDLLSSLAPAPPHSTLHAHPKLQLVASKDCNSLNAGSLLFRLQPFTNEMISPKKLVEHLWQLRKREQLPYREQHALRTLLHPSTAGSLDLSQHTSYALQQHLNAFPQPNSCLGIGSRNWEPGDFVAHYPGCSVTVARRGELPMDVREGKYGDFGNWGCGEWTEYLLSSVVGKTTMKQGDDDDDDGKIWEDEVRGMPREAVERLGFVEMGGEDDGDWRERQRVWDADEGGGDNAE